MPTIETRLRGHGMNFKATFGLFSPKMIDIGSEQLLKQIKMPDDARVLDLGCGYGPIGLTLAKEAEYVHLIDKDFVAVEYSNHNAVLNGLENTTVYLSNGFSHVPDETRFDIIVSNIPAKVGKEMLHQILDDCKIFLEPGGSVYIVVIVGLKEFMKRELKARFGNYKKLTSVKGYYCLSAKYE